MHVRQLAEALFEAHQQRSTGWMTFCADGRESQLLIDRGNLVGADIRSEHRSMAQSLLCAGLLDTQALDSLWAEGGGNGKRAVEVLGLPEERAGEIQLLVQIERLGEKATGVRFEAGAVTPRFSPIPGERVARAASQLCDAGGSDGWKFDRDGQEAAPADGLEAVLLKYASENQESSTAEASTKGGQFAGSDTRLADEVDVADDPVDPDQAARARRQRLLRRAMENMGALAAPPSQVSVVPVDSLPAEQIPSPADAQAGLSTDEMQLVAAVERKFYQIESGADCFVVLEVGRQATHDEVKAAFLELAKVFHPDRLPPSVAHLAAKMRAVFEAVREAHDVLQDASRRVAYLASLREEKRPDAGANPAGDAVEAFKRGEALLRKRDYAGAEREYHRAYLADPQATYLAAEAWAIHLDPARRDQAARAKQMIAEAAKKDPDCARAQYQLGVIARVEGDVVRAERHFLEAVRVNPKHFEAAQELRLIRMRKKKNRG